jgi:hypothetical protein
MATIKRKTKYKSKSRSRSRSRSVNKKYSNKGKTLKHRIQKGGKEGKEGKGFFKAKAKPKPIISNPTNPRHTGFANSGKITRESFATPQQQITPNTLGQKLGVELTNTKRKLGQGAIPTPGIAYDITRSALIKSPAQAVQAAPKRSFSEYFTSRGLEVNTDPGRKISEALGALGAPAAPAPPPAPVATAPAAVTAPARPPVLPKPVILGQGQGEIEASSAAEKGNFDASVIAGESKPNNKLGLSLNSGTNLKESSTTEPTTERKKNRVGLGELLSQQISKVMTSVSGPKLTPKQLENAEVAFLKNKQKQEAKLEAKQAAERDKAMALSTAFTNLEAKRREILGEEHYKPLTYTQRLTINASNNFNVEKVIERTKLRANELRKQKVEELI